MAVDTGTASIGFLLARILFGGVLAFMGLNHFLDRKTMTGYAEMKGVPAAGIAVPASGAALILGGLGIIFGVYPSVASLALVGFFVLATPLMHDFWAVPDDQQQNEMVNFLKNVALTGGALVFFALSTESWGYALNVGL